MGNRCGIGVLVDPGRFGDGVTNPASPSTFTAEDGDGRSHRRPRPFPTGPPAFLSPSPATESGEGWRSSPAPRFASPDFRIREMREIAFAWRRG